MTREHLNPVGREPTSGLLLPTALKLPLPPTVGCLLTNLVDTQNNKSRVMNNFSFVHVQAMTG